MGDYTGAGALTLHGRQALDGTQIVYVDHDFTNAIVDGTNTGLDNAPASGGTASSVTITGISSGVTLPVEVENTSSNAVPISGAVTASITGNQPVQIAGVDSGVTFPVTDNSGSLTIDTGGAALSTTDTNIAAGAIEVDGSVEVTTATGTSLSVTSTSTGYSAVEQFILTSTGANKLAAKNIPDWAYVRMIGVLVTATNAAGDPAINNWTGTGFNTGSENVVQGRLARISLSYDSTAGTGTLNTSLNTLKSSSWLDYSSGTGVDPGSLTLIRGVDWLYGSE